MLQFVCDYCRDVQKAGEVWITGIAAENVGTQAARREVIVDPAWRRERAVLPFAVHFCSVECKDNYLSEMFHRPATLLEVESSEAAPGRGIRVIHAKKKPVPSSAQTGAKARKPGLRQK